MQLTRISLALGSDGSPRAVRAGLPFWTIGLVDRRGFPTWITAIESLLFRWLEGSGSREAANANLAQG